MNSQKIQEHKSLATKFSSTIHAIVNNQELDSKKISEINVSKLHVSPSILSPNILYRKWGVVMTVSIKAYYGEKMLEMNSKA